MCVLYFPESKSHQCISHTYTLVFVQFISKQCNLHTHYAYYHTHYAYYHTCMYTILYTYMYIINCTVNLHFTDLIMLFCRRFIHLQQCWIKRSRHVCWNICNHFDDNAPEIPGQVGSLCTDCASFFPAEVQLQTEVEATSSAIQFVVCGSNPRQLPGHCWSTAEIGQ